MSKETSDYLTILNALNKVAPFDEDEEEHDSEVKDAFEHSNSVDESNLSSPFRRHSLL